MRKMKKEARRVQFKEFVKSYRNGRKEKRKEPEKELKADQKNKSSKAKVKTKEKKQESKKENQISLKNPTEEDVDEFIDDIFKSVKEQRVFFSSISPLFFHFLYSFSTSRKRRANQELQKLKKVNKFDLFRLLMTSCFYIPTLAFKDNFFDSRGTKSNFCLLSYSLYTDYSQIEKTKGRRLRKVTVCTLWTNFRLGKEETLNSVPLIANVVFEKINLPLKRSNRFQNDSLEQAFKLVPL